MSRAQLSFIRKSWSLFVFLYVEQLCFGGHRLSLGFRGEDALVAVLTTGLEVAFLPCFFLLVG